MVDSKHGLKSSKNAFLFAEQIASSTYHTLLIFVDLFYWSIDQLWWSTCVAWCFHVITGTKESAEGVLRYYSNLVYICYRLRGVWRKLIDDKNTVFSLSLFKFHWLAKVGCWIGLWIFTNKSFSISLKTMSEKLCLQWNDFRENAIGSLGSLKNDRDFLDVTLISEDGKKVEAH